jgi:Tol biopolymer transport system component
MPNRFYNADPAWSPDGSMITFTTTRNGLFQITVMNGDGSDKSVISTGALEEGFPDWQPVVGGDGMILRARLRRSYDSLKQ